MKFKIENNVLDIEYLCNLFVNNDTYKIIGIEYLHNGKRNYIAFSKRIEDNSYILIDYKNKIPVYKKSVNDSSLTNYIYSIEELKEILLNTLEFVNCNYIIIE